MNHRALGTVAATVALAVLVPRAGVAAEPFEQINTLKIDAMAFPRGVRSLGMGMTGTGDAFDPANVWYNPAVLAYSPGIGITGGTNNWTSGFDFSDIGLSAAYRVPSGDNAAWNVGAGLRYTTMDFGGANDDEPTAIGTFPPLDGFTDWYLASTVAGGYSPGNFDFAAGFTVKYLKGDQIITAEFDTWAWDVGLLGRYTYHRQDGLNVITTAGVSGLSLGGSDAGPLVIQSIEQFRAGMGIRVEASGLQESGESLGHFDPIMAIGINGEVVDYSDTDRKTGSSVGIEMSLINVLSVRFGYADSQYAFDYGQTFGGGLGYGWGRTYVRLDLAMAFETNLSKNISSFGFLVDIDI